MEISSITFQYSAGHEVKTSKENVKESRFLDTYIEKSANKVDFDEKSFEYMAPNAPEEVKKAWMEAAKETGTNGMGMAPNGMLTHISAMMVNRAVNWMNGEENNADVLGNSVGSALEAARQALYNLDNPLEPLSKRSLEVQQEILKERNFYQSFIDKLQNL